MHQQAPAASTRSYKLNPPRRWPWVMLVLAVGGGIAGAAYKYELDTQPTRQPVPTTLPGDTVPAAEQSVPVETTAPDPRLGATALTSGYEVTPLSFVDPWTSNRGLVAPEGHRFVAVEMQLKNVHTQLQVFSSLIGLEIIDANDRVWKAEKIGEELPGLTGALAQDQEVIGWQVFEVAADSTGFRLHVRGSYTAGGVTFDLTPAA